MEFWGAEVKPGKPLKMTPEEDNLIHISQATLDCNKKMGESVTLTVTVDGSKFVIGVLSQDKFPHISFDLVFEKEFELSHNCTKGSVHFIGYKSPNIEDGEEGHFFSDSDEEEEKEVSEASAITTNGDAGASALNAVKADTKPKAKPEEVKPEEVKPEEVKPESDDDDEDDSDEEDEEDEEDESDDDDSEKEMDADEDDSDDDDEDSEEEEEETPKKPEPINKKRPNESASKTPVSGKKAKPAATSPQKTGSEEKKKGGHTSTPYPGKKCGVLPTKRSPKSGGESSGGNNKKPFNNGKQFGGSNKGKGKGKGRA